MQPHTGHLVDLESSDFKNKLEELKRNGYEKLPENLNHAASCKLAGKSEAHVSLTSGGKLSKHAAYLRKRKRQKAKASRRKNRSWGGK